MKLEGEPVPVLTGGTQQVVGGKGERRELVAVAVLLSGRRLPLVPLACPDDLVDNFDPVRYLVVLN